MIAPKDVVGTALKVRVWPYDIPANNIAAPIRPGNLLLKFAIASPCEFCLFESVEVLAQPEPQLQQNTLVQPLGTSPCRAELRLACFPEAVGKGGTTRRVRAILY
jgi:hypothetical protein